MVTTLPEVMLQLQTAVQERLTGDPVLMGIITGVFDWAPERQTFPYVTYGQHVDGPFDAFGLVGTNGYFLLDVWSGDTSSSDECYAILSEIKRLLCPAYGADALTLVDYSLVDFAYEWSTILFDNENRLRHMPLRFAVQAQQQIEA
jgi:hypothetical protein